MKLHYYRDTDSLYIELTDRESADSREVADGVVLDFDATGQIVGIDIEHASTHVQLGRVVVAGMDDAVLAAERLIA
jgi:uncharacterized protein YuzE